MSMYTTGEIAKLCGVSVRTVQYYDTRDILHPSELTEGGRRLYSEGDLEKMKIICFLREMDFPIKNIGELFSEEDPGTVISALIEQQEDLLLNEVRERQEKLNLLMNLKNEMKNISDFSVESIGDIAHIMQNKNKLKKIHAMLILTGIPMDIMEITSIMLWIGQGIWWPFAFYTSLIVPYIVWTFYYYFRKVSYLCPQCHTVFKPGKREAFFAPHTPNTRKLTCPCCGKKGYCIEIYKEEESIRG